SQLNWNGTLTRSEMGFDSFLASSVSSPAPAVWAADDWAKALLDRQNTKELAASAELFREGVSIISPLRVDGVSEGGCYSLARAVPRVAVRSTQWERPTDPTDHGELEAFRLRGTKR